MNSHPYNQHFICDKKVKSVDFLQHSVLELRAHVYYCQYGFSLPNIFEAF